MEVEPIRDFNDVKAMYRWLLENYNQREAECFLIGCNVALRAGDLLGLTIDQLDGESTFIIEGKSGKKVEIPVTKEISDSVSRLKDYYKSKNFTPSYLFQSTSNRTKKLCQPICIQWLGAALKEAAKEIGLDYNVNTHSMRKTWAYHAYENGADIHYIQSLLNHANQHITLKYIGVTRKALKKLYEDNALSIA